MFRIALKAQQAELQERVETLKIAVAGLEAHTEVKRAEEIANEMRRIHKEIKDCLDTATVYARRESLLGVTPTEFDHIEEILRQFETVRALWSYYAEWTKWLVIWMRDPLINVDGENLVNTIGETMKFLDKADELFEHLPSQKQVALLLKAEIENFRPDMEILANLRVTVSGFNNGASGI